MASVSKKISLCAVAPCRFDVSKSLWTCVLAPKRELTHGGFTLVELLVAVAIVGILSCLSIPQYERLRSRARQSEAKIALSAIYAAEKSFALENGTYTTCLAQAGYEPEGLSGGRGGPRRYYRIGFRNAIADLFGCGPEGNLTCNSFGNWSRVGGVLLHCLPAVDGSTFYSATATVDANAGLANDGDLATTQISQSRFVVGAGGQISTSGRLGNRSRDIWTIDDQKNLTNIQTSL